MWFINFTNTDVSHWGLLSSVSRAAIIFSWMTFCWTRNSELRKRWANSPIVKHCCLSGIRGHRAEIEVTDHEDLRRPFFVSNQKRNPNTDKKTRNVDQAHIRKLLWTESLFPLSVSPPFFPLSFECHGKLLSVWEGIRQGDTERCVTWMYKLIFRIRGSTRYCIHEDVLVAKNRN